MTDPKTEGVAWYKDTRWGDKPIAKTFIRETDKMLISIDSLGEERREAKVSRYSQWYPTCEEAQARIDERLNLKAKKRADKRVRDAALELLEALQGLIAEIDDCSQPDDWEHYPAAIAAIAKATGQ
jgi:hypothetical protein